MFKQLASSTSRKPDDRFKVKCNNQINFSCKENKTHAKALWDFFFLLFISSSSSLCKIGGKNFLKKDSKSVKNGLGFNWFRRKSKGGEGTFKLKEDLFCRSLIWKRGLWGSLNWKRVFVDL